MFKLALALFLLLSCISSVHMRRLRPPSPPHPPTHTPSSTNINPPTVVVGPEQRVDALPGLGPGHNYSMYAGHALVDKKTGGYLYYWLIEAETAPESAPLVLWLNGGPGCSSMEALFAENGPFRVQADLSLDIARYSWTRYANMLWVEQPVGTGFAFTLSPKDGLADNMDQAEDAFWSFLTQFYAGFPAYRDRPLYLAGESFAGVYVPIYANRIVQETARNPRLGIRLAGVGIGNGWSDPETQWRGDIDFSFGMGLISLEQRRTLQSMLETCKRDLQVYETMDLYNNACLDIEETILESTGTAQAGRMNMYDIRSYLVDQDDWPPQEEFLDAYLNQPAVREALHTELMPYNYSICSDTVYHALMPAGYNSTRELLTSLLESEVPVLLWSGQYDWICNHVGTEYMLDALLWPGASSLTMANRTTWIYDGAVAGYVRTYANLTYALVLGGSHMAAVDVPGPMYDLMYRFIHNASFADATQPVPPSMPTSTYDSKIPLYGWVLMACFSGLLGVALPVVVAVWYHRGKD